VYGSSNEHSTLYNWQLQGAENIFLGHIQSETPYHQGKGLNATWPYAPLNAGTELAIHDPLFRECNRQANTCLESWALRIIDSSKVFIYGAALFSFFNEYSDSCVQRGGVCQEKLIDVASSKDVYLYSLYTAGAREVISPRNGAQAIINKDVQHGFATSVVAWLMLAAQ
jgi:hypothetical protein